MKKVYFLIICMKYYILNKKYDNFRNTNNNYYILYLVDYM